MLNRRKPTATVTITTTSLIMTTTERKVRAYSSWNQYGYTIVGSDGPSPNLTELHSPTGIDIDDDGTVYICDSMNHRIIRRRSNSTTNEVVAGGNGEGNRIDQLNTPLDVIIDKKKNSLTICDFKNYRIMRWSLQNQTEPQIIISKIVCRGLAIDQDGTIYVSEYYNDIGIVKRFKDGDLDGEIIAGGNGRGNHSNQLMAPSYRFVDHDYSVYISERENTRISKWLKDAKEGIVVSGPSFGGNMRQMRYNRGFTLDCFGHIFIADSWNNRIVRWSKDLHDVMVILGGYGWGRKLHELNRPDDVVLDRQGNLYVVDTNNHRVLKFDAED
ncbi:unnamed protein product [Adineta ricciae]|uniref:Uncharacterized protein n=1 Tax=Adineta ricciae TaxID=249248 RepID=A0A815YSJ1_ADIRI|nr:unnamed protein product [Adineta ricciae]CAF1575074.1 unnamed protein product [Adineta ricciae]